MVPTTLQYGYVSNNNLSCVLIVNSLNKIFSWSVVLFFYLYIIAAAFAGATQSGHPSVGTGARGGSRGGSLGAREPPPLRIKQEKFVLGIKSKNASSLILCLPIFPYHVMILRSPDPNL